jgi:metal-responsive CopG/Arc/MetJ family transcriptional regulator
LVWYIDRIRRKERYQNRKNIVAKLLRNYFKEEKKDRKACEVYAFMQNRKGEKGMETQSKERGDAYIYKSGNNFLGSTRSEIQTKLAFCGYSEIIR